jgi:hypothetical protein
MTTTVDWPAWWEGHYAAGHISGRDSRGELAAAKADYVNTVIVREGITSLIDWGCGDGVQQELLAVDRYHGVDLSPTAIGKCLERSPHREFTVWDDDIVVAPAELGLSMSVLYHLVDDFDYAAYLARLFGRASRFVVVFATDVERPQRDHLRHRRWSVDVPDGWELAEFTPWPHKEDETLGHYLYARSA